jgi:hypothetical protein
MKTTARVAFIALAMLASCPAWAEEGNGYLGASLGSGLASRCQEDLTRACAELVTLRIFAGYHFNPRFALEGAVLALDRDAGTALELTGVGLAPLDERVALYGKLGGFVGGTQSGLTLGAGVRFNLSETFGLRLEWQGYYARDTGDMVSLGVFFRF